jgi:hypothetical protein
MRARQPRADWWAWVMVVLIVGGYVVLTALTYVVDAW